MNFRTQIPLKKQERNLINYHSKVMLLGSCFSDNIGAKFEYYKFQNTINPFGIMFHPKAIETFLDSVVNQKKYSENELVFQNDQYHCFDAHSSLSNLSAEMLVNNLNDILKSTHKQIKESTHLVITLGTAWVYEYIESNRIVTNCHKIPQKQFTKRILSIQEIIDSLCNIEELVKVVNPTIQLIYTVSPVRHIKDGFVENQQSKSHLLSATHKILNANSVSYFPSYEIMMDDLRDYRFYKEDMIHPNQMAIDYIWSQFKTVWLDDSTKPIMKEITTIQNGLGHRPFNSKSEQHLKFLKSLKDKIVQLQSHYPFIEF